MRRKGLLLLIALVCFIPSIFAKTGDTMYVAISQAELKESTGFFAKEVGSVFYGDALNVLSEKGDWVRVSVAHNKTIVGWIKTGSLSKRKIVVTSNGKTTSASAEELSLAGKGFSPEVEAQYKTQIGDDAYKLVDDIENNVVDEEDLLIFIQEGNLEGGEE